jgi:hypothetical protein
VGRNQNILPRQGVIAAVRVFGGVKHGSSEKIRGYRALPHNNDSGIKVIKCGCNHE